MYVKKVFDHYHFNEKELTEILLKSARYNVVKLWNIEQIDWVVELSRMKMEGDFFCFGSSCMAERATFSTSPKFRKRIERGELRIISFNKKT